MEIFVRLSFRLCSLQFAFILAAAMLLPEHASAQNSPKPSGDAASAPAGAGAANNTPGQFDYYLLDMPWGPAFCSSIKDVSSTCKPQPGFVVHGLWPQNNDGTWPQFCATTPAPPTLASSLDITPDLGLLKHEWDKHGTCSGLGAAQFFQAAHGAFAQITLPTAFIQLNNSRTFTPLFALNMFYQANPGFPAGSFSLSCKDGHVTAIEACFSKTLQPIRCLGLQSCDAQIVRFDPPPSAPDTTP